MSLYTSSPIVLHVAAGEVASPHSTTRARASSHFYVRRDGTIEQRAAIEPPRNEGDA